MSIWSIQELTPSQHSAAGRQRKEARLYRGVVLERAGELGRDGAHAWRAHAPQRHAHVLGLEHRRYAARFEALVYRGRNLHGQVLPTLQPSCVKADEARDLGQPQYDASTLEVIAEMPG